MVKKDIDQKNMVVVVDMGGCGGGGSSSSSSSSNRPDLHLSSTLAH